MALEQNSNVNVLKLGYNSLEDDGVEILAPLLSEHVSLESVDLGFNNVRDAGCRALVDAIPADGRAWTLYLAGNLIGEDGAGAIADMIRRRCCVRKLNLTGNRLGPGGVAVIVDAIIEDECNRNASRDSNSNHDNNDKSNNTGAVDGAGDATMNGTSSASGSCMSKASGTTTSSGAPFSGIEELLLGGTRMGPGGCEAISRLVGRSASLRTLDLSNCSIGDEEMSVIATSIKSNRTSLPLESLQLSFNRITCRGMEHLSNAIWGSRTLKELHLDNNEIGDNGAQLVAAVVPFVRTLETLNVGFNKIKSSGMKLLMKAVSESKSILNLSVSGNSIDTASAQFTAYALAHSTSLQSVSFDHCSISKEAQRHIVAGIVSNRRTGLREIRGFDVGPIIVTLGFPAVMEHWNNEHVINFIHLMWERRPGGMDVDKADEKELDPLNFLDANGASSSSAKPAPLEAHAVVEIANKTFESLVQEGVDVFTRRPRNPEEDSHVGSAGQDDGDSDSSMEPMPTRQNHSFVAAPEESSKSTGPDPSRKKRIVEWLCSNIQHLNKLSQKPFSSAELWHLHQHFFTPVVNESGGSVAPSPNPSAEPLAVTFSSVPEVSRSSSSTSHGASFPESTDTDPSSKSSPNGITSLPMLKRKVSYRFLGEAAVAATAPRLDLACRRASHTANATSVSMLIEGSPAFHSLPPKNKRARRNRTRISFLPRVKAKLDSLLDVCHEKALVTMRQLYYVEQAILKGEVNPIDPKRTSRTHLCGEFATDAEMIVVDMI